MKKKCFLFILLFLPLSLKVSIAVENFKPGINGVDDRVLFLRNGHPWDAIGQVNISGYRRITRCTGTLIASNLVITAAHCLIDQSTNKHWPLNTIHFVAGVKGELSRGHATAKCLKFIKGFKILSESIKMIWS
ncbi:MAG: trypsin-like serine peptidase [Hyphomicrobium sp.]